MRFLVRWSRQLTPQARLRCNHTRRTQACMQACLQGTASANPKLSVLALMHLLAASSAVENATHMSEPVH